MLAILALVFTGCELLNPEKIGAYTCDEYCGEVIAKTEECAQTALDEQCAENPDLCAEYSEEELAEYAAQGRSDWSGASKEDMLASCNDDLASAGKSDTECQAETALLNNLSCNDILSLLGEIQSGA